MKKIKKAYQFVTQDVWRMSPKGKNKRRDFGIQVIKTLVLSVRGFNENDINMRANALTYSLMFATVPIMAFIIAIGRGFGFEQVIEDYLNQSFLGKFDIVPTIMEFVERYLETAQGGVFIGVGILVLLWAVYSFFQNVESSFNRIWQVGKSRSIIRQLANYLTVLLLIPILLIVSSGISIYLNSQMAEVALFAEATVMELILKSIPWLISWTMFFLIYKTIPNTQVSLNSALIPGILVGTLVQILQMATVYFIMFLSRTSIVYGVFAAIPLLLMWLQWTCLLILIGAELSYAIQNNESFDFEADVRQMSRRYKDYLTLYILCQIVKRFEKGESALCAADIAKHDNLPVRIVNQLLSRLCTVKLITQIGTEDENTVPTYQPALDINKITIGLVFNRIDAQGSELFLPDLPAGMQKFWEKWLEIKNSYHDIDKVLIKDLIQ
ncbi:MAG: YihY/virulence factor BrkB family protein [Paludibacteraceae bacterium]|nr:YihY/virulence factor BrkB family protein [Paludibacteraceae bacterium]